MSKLRLLVVINNFPPDRGGGAAVIGDMCHALAERGFDVTVRCAYPYYPEWTDKSGRNGFSIWRYEDRGVKVERYGLYIPSNPNSVRQRLLHELSFLLSLMRSLRRGRQFDVVMAYCPAVSCLAFAAINKLIWRRPLWLNIQDLAAQAATASGLVRWRWLDQVLSAVQRWFFNRADVWSTISPVMVERLKPMRRRNQPLLFQPNWLNASLAGEIEQLKHNSPPRNCHQPLRLLYAGNIGKKQHLLTLLKLLHKSDAKFEFAIHGNGAQASKVERWVADVRDSRFRFGPFLDERKFAGVLNWTDLFVITETGAGGSSFMPSKLVPGIASGAPILAVCGSHSPLGLEVRSNAIGPCFSWTEAPHIVGLLSVLPQQAGRYQDWSRRALARAAEYDRDVIIGRFEDALRRLTLDDHPASE